MQLTFHGGAQSVTGANHLLETETTRVLVDCGMVQGNAFCDECNSADFVYDPATIDALIVTHAHIDHTGRIPKLVRDGFKGKIYSTHPTKDFAAIMLEDSLGVLEKESKRRGEKPFYEMKDVEQALALWEGKEYGESFMIGDMRVVFHDAGHILGSLMAEINHEDKKVLFTGDLGNVPNPLLRPYPLPKGVTHLVMESVYGDRNHEDHKLRKDKLENAIEDVVRRKGVLMIPAFALERTQELLFEMNELVENGRIPSVPVFIDSPLAIKATKIYKKYAKYYNETAKKLLLGGDDLFQFPNLKFTLETDESKRIKSVSAPKIVTAGSGMMNGGRITHHALNYLGDKNNMILFVGYAAASSPARRIQEGAKTVHFHGQEVAVKAEIRHVDGYSAHADHDALIEFVNATRDSLEHVYVVQGEPKSALFLTQRIRDYLGVDAIAPKQDQSVEL